MTTFEDELEARLEDLAHTADPAGESRVLRGVNRAGRARRRRKIAAFTLGIAAASGLLLSLNGLGVIGDRGPQTQTAQTGGERGHDPRADGIGGVQPGEPCPMAKHAPSVAALQQQTDVPIWEPANATLTDAWTCGDTPVLLYGQIQITYDDDKQAWGNIDIEKKWADRVRDRGGRVETVLGRPALVTPADATGPPTNRPVYPDPADAAGRVSVMVVVDGTLISTVAKGDVPVEKLIELTNSIKLPPSLAR